MSTFEEVKDKARSRARGPRKDAMGHLYVEQILRNAHFQGDIQSDADTLKKYSTDESIFSIRPQFVIAPKNVEDVKIAVKTIAAHTKTFPALSLTPRAAGTGLSGGSLTDSVMVDMKRYMNTLGAYDPATGRITVEPGAMLPVVEAELKKYDRYLPAYPASKDICTVGGCVANNAAGADSLRFGHFAESVGAMEVVLADGNVYTIEPMSFDGYKSLIRQNHAYATIAKQVYELIKSNEVLLQQAKPKTKKNTAGYPLWDVVKPSIAEFEAGRGTMDLTRLFSGSQGTIGIITKLILKTEPIHHDTVLLQVPVYDLKKAGDLIRHVLQYNPINVELYDGESFRLAVENPMFFRSRMERWPFYRLVFSLYYTYYAIYKKRAPEFTLLITVDTKETEYSAFDIQKGTKEATGLPITIVNDPHQVEMFWQVRNASYSLSKLQDPEKRPAAFLEDMTVPPEYISEFFTDIKRLLKKYDVKAAVHGHGGNGHLHFYPLLDFTKDQGATIEAMSEEFFNTAVKYHGNICGEHNDGIIRTPHLNKIYSKKVLDLFRAMEATFDPDDIFNPGKKVNPRFDIKQSLRHTN